MTAFSATEEGGVFVQEVYGDEPVVSLRVTGGGRSGQCAREAGSADFSDHVIRESSREAGALPVLTFDEGFARATDVEHVPR